MDYRMKKNYLKNNFFAFKQIVNVSIQPEA